MVVGGVVPDIKQFTIGFTKVGGILLCLVGRKRDRLSNFVLVAIKSLLQIQRMSYSGINSPHAISLLYSGATNPEHSLFSYFFWLSHGILFHV